MKTKFTTFYFLLLLCFSLLTIQCTKEEDIPAFDEELFTTGTTPIRYGLGGFPIEGYVKITKQPAHYAISEIKADSSLYYEYIAEVGFSGSSYVEITFAYSPGNSNYTKTKRTLKLTVQ